MNVLLFSPFAHCSVMLLPNSLPTSYLFQCAALQEVLICKEIKFNVSLI